MTTKIHLEQNFLYILPGLVQEWTNIHIFVSPASNKLDTPPGMKVFAETSRWLIVMDVNRSVARRPFLLVTVERIIVYESIIDKL